MTESPTLDAVGHAALVRSGEASATELVEAAIARISAHDPGLNAVVTPLFEKARAEAAAVRPGLPLAGVPYVLKDHLTCSAGDPVSDGIRAVREARWAPDYDSHYVTRMRAAGAVLVGKSNLPELALQSTTEPEAWGPSRNAWDPDRSAGGSSGGSGVAVASGMVPVGHATDAGGSIRIPASFNGVVGLKPSRGRVSQGPGAGDMWATGSWYLGALTRTVRDTAAVLDVVSGAEPGDPVVAPPPTRPFADEVGADPGRLRVGFLARTVAGYPALDPDIAEGVRATARLLSDLGHDVEEAHPPALDRQLDGALDGFMGLIGSGVGWSLQQWSQRLGRPLGEQDVEPATWLVKRAGDALSGADFVAALDVVQAYGRSVAGWWADYDLLLTPTTAVEAPPLDVDRLALRDPAAAVRASAELTGGFTIPFNITGQPAISLPLHWTREGLPVGMQFAAAYAREDLLLRLAAQLETAAPWLDRRPPVADIDRATLLQ